MLPNAEQIGMGGLHVYVLGMATSAGEHAAEMYEAATKYTELYNVVKGQPIQRYLLPFHHPACYVFDGKPFVAVRPSLSLGQILHLGLTCIPTSSLTALCVQGL
jgi:hypothetical protein